MIKIGICDDEKISREQLKELLEQFFEKNSLGFQLWEYESGADFLERGEEIHLLFLDIEMNEMSGIQLKEELQGYQDNFCYEPYGRDAGGIWQECLWISGETGSVRETGEVFTACAEGF